MVLCQAHLPNGWTPAVSGVSAKVLQASLQLIQLILNVDGLVLTPGAVAVAQRSWVWKGS